MADPTLGDIMVKLASIEAKQTRIELEQQEQTALLTALVTKGQLIMSNLDTINATLDALNTATSQEAALLQADTATLTQIQATETSNGPKLDAIQALITSLLNTADIPQAVLDKATAAQAAVSGLIATSTANQTALASIVSNTTAQSARLDQLATDPRNPVPTPPPAPRAG